MNHNRPMVNVVVTESDQARARVIVVAWRQNFWNGVSGADASLDPLVGAIAEALAAERRGGLVAYAAAEECAALLRRAVGVVSDVAKLQGEASAVLDAYART